MCLKHMYQTGSKCSGTKGEKKKKKTIKLQRKYLISSTIKMKSQSGLKMGFIYVSLHLLHSFN